MFRGATNMSLIADQMDSIPTIDESVLKSYSLGKLLVSVSYGLVFGLGELANIWVFLMTSKILYSKRNQTCRYICRYILALSLSDIILLSYLPLFIVDQNQRSWEFGSAVCKIYFGLEGVNKLLSVYILTAIGLERFLATWRPVGNCQLQSNRRTLAILISSLIMALVIMSPAFIHSNLYQQEFNFTSQSAIDNDTVWHVEEIKRCAFLAPEAFQEKFVLFSFLVGFCIPTTLMLLFYGGSFVAIRYHSRLTHRWSNRNRVVTCKILTVVFCYLMCWTPYWGFAVVGIFYSELLRNPTDLIIYLAIFIHLLPYISCGLNPWLYVAISEDLRKNMRPPKFPTRASADVTKESSRQLRTARQFQLDEMNSLELLNMKSIRRATECSSSNEKIKWFRRRTRSDL